MKRITIEPLYRDDGRQDGYGAYEHGVYEKSSVLAGQPSRTFRGGFDTVEKALEWFPLADVLEHSTKQDVETMLPRTAPDWFDPADAGERWDDDY